LLQVLQESEGAGAGAAAVSRQAQPAPADAVVAQLLARLEQRLPEVGARLVDRYRAEIVDYQALGERTLAGDIAQTAIANLEELVADLRAGTPIDSSRLERFRRSAVRRAHQGVTFRGLLHAYRLWGQVVWEEMLSTARTDDPAEREAALRMASRIMDHVDTVSTAVAEAYMDEVAGVWSDREVVRRDLLELLVSGRGTEDQIRRKTASFKFEVAEAHVVVVARHVDAAEVGGSEWRAVLAKARDHLKPPVGALLVGLREQEAVAIYPAPTPEGEGLADRQARALAATLQDFIVGIGRRQPGVKGIATSYRDAHEAIQIGMETGVRGRAIPFADVLLDHILRSSPYSAELLEETLRPIRDYDAVKNADLTLTLKSYFETGFNLTRSAAALHVHVNTVVYRLDRIRRLTGRDPSDPDDLLLLVLGLKLLEVGRGDRASAPERRSHASP